jgi:hypothetical protein
LPRELLVGPGFAKRLGPILYTFLVGPWSILLLRFIWTRAVAGQQKSRAAVDHPLIFLSV